MPPTFNPPAPVPATSSAAGAWYMSQCSADLDSFSRVHGAWPLAFEPLAGGRFEARLDYLQLPGLRVVRTSISQALRQHGAMDAGCCGFALATRQPGPARFSGQRLLPDTAMVGRADELDLCSPADFELLGCVIDRALLDGLAGAPGAGRPPPWLSHRLVLPLPPATRQGLLQAMRQALAQIVARPALLQQPQALAQLRDALAQRWLEALPQQVDLRPLKSVAARRRVVERARALVLAQPDRPWSMLELCRQLGASPRKLSYCFNEYLGLSPARYLRLLRLLGVHRALRQAGTAHSSVQALAADWGFWHLGQFASDYRRQFGELPSQTLRRAGKAPA